MRKWMILVLLLVCVSCAPLLKYDPPKTEPIKKIEPYVLPSDPFASVEAPKAIFLTRLDNGLFKEVPKEESTVVAYVAKEHDKIVLRLQYYKELVPSLVRLINIEIEIGNARIQLQMDEGLAKELYKQMWMDAENRRMVDQRWNDLEKGGYWAIILGQLIAIISGGL